MSRLRIIVTFSIALFAIMKFSITSHASEWNNSFSVTDPTVYSGGAWYESYSFSINVEGLEMGLSCTYGYDTWWTHEDYIKEIRGIPAGFYGKGRVRNSSGSATDTAYIPSGYNTGYADVAHTGVPVTFTGFLKNS